MKDEQQYQINFSVPENLGSKQSVFHKFTSIAAVVNDETYYQNLELKCISTKTLTHIDLLYST